MTVTFKERATSLTLGFITLVGTFLVGEQIITGEQLAEVQGITGLALAGGGFTLSTLLYTVRVLVPKQAIENLLVKVGEEKVNKFFETNDMIYNELQALRNEFNEVKEQLAKEREEKEALKIELGL
jgi:hypothetical protein